jgi:hypothetical protein
MHRPNRRHVLAAASALACPMLGRAQTGEVDHAAWTSLLQRQVVLLRGGQASQVRYAGFAADRAALKAYLTSLSAVSRPAFDRWAKPAQMAFLINAYNAFTVELILTKYPDLGSIKDLGSLFSSPWKPKWIPLLGVQMSLDDIEHGLLRERGRYDDPRIHFAVNCASVGCPMLREEAFTGDRLEAQLEQQTRRFLADRTRNRWNPRRARREVSKIVDWYGDDFRQGHRGIRSLPAFFAAHADLLADGADERARVRSAEVDIGFLDYDWALNDARG